MVGIKCKTVCLQNKFIDDGAVVWEKASVDAVILCCTEQETLGSLVDVTLTMSLP